MTGNRLPKAVLASVLCAALVLCPACASAGVEQPEDDSALQGALLGSSSSAPDPDAVAAGSSSQNSAGERPTVRILCIGNSWTGRCIRNFGAIAASAGKNAIVGYAFLSKGTLQEQYFALRNGGGTFTCNGKRKKVRPTIEYRKFIGADTRKFHKGSTLDRALKDEKWDYIILQNRAPESGDYSVWDKRARGNSDALIKGKKKIKFDINDFVDLIEKRMGTKNAAHAKVGISAVWSFAPGQNGGVSGAIGRYIAHRNKGKKPQTQKAWNALYKKLHKDIQTTMRRVKKHMGKRCDFIVNPGLALYRAQGKASLASFGYKMRAARTDAHPAEGLPCYVVTLAYAYKTLGLKAGQKLWYPTEATVSYRTGKGGKLVKYQKRATEKLARQALAIVSQMQ